MRFAPLNPDASPRYTSKKHGRMAAAASVAAAMTATTATAAVEDHRAALTCEHEFHAGCVRERITTFSLRHVCLDPQCVAARLQTSCTFSSTRPSTRATASSRFCTPTASSARLKACQSFVELKLAFSAYCVVQ